MVVPLGTFKLTDSEREVLCRMLEACKTEQDMSAVMQAFLLGRLLTDILLTPPRYREHFWQIWRRRRPRI